jgi:hypothetical protein
VALFFHDAQGAESRKRPQVKSALRLKDRGGTVYALSPFPSRRVGFCTAVSRRGQLFASAEAMWEKIRDERYCRERIGRVQIRRLASAR